MASGWDNTQGVPIGTFVLGKLAGFRNFGEFLSRVGQRENPIEILGTRLNLRPNSRLKKYKIPMKFPRLPPLFTATKQRGKGSIQLRKQLYIGLERQQQRSSDMAPLLSGYGRGNALCG